VIKSSDISYQQDVWQEKTTMLGLLGGEKYDDTLNDLNTVHKCDERTEL